MKNRFAILMVVSIVLVMTLSACGAVKDISTVNDLGKSFMTAMRDGDAESSWNMLTADVQTEVGDIAAWVEFITPRNFSEWSFSNTQVDNDVAQMDGEGTLGSETYDITLVFDKIDNAWLISGINILVQE